MEENSIQGLLCEDGVSIHATGVTVSQSLHGELGQQAQT